MRVGKSKLGRRFIQAKSKAAEQLFLLFDRAEQALYMIECASKLGLISPLLLSINSKNEIKKALVWSDLLTYDNVFSQFADNVFL